jgi:4-hydroxy-3-methylbut-2-enyl diphosphate reductase
MTAKTKALKTIMNNNSIMPPLHILLASPRGFCAGVDRAIKIVEEALAIHGAPVYVRHEIVHNQFVVQSLREKGVVFVETLDEIDDLSRPVIFSAHGVSKSVVNTAKFKNLFYIDATCPLVSKVHRETERHHQNDFFICLIGHENHPEVIGTMGQIPKDAITLIETEDDARNFTPPTNAKGLAYVTQTTLSMDDTSSIIAILKSRFPDIHGPQKSDICYATTNRQDAVKTMAPQCDHFFVVGSYNSSNAQRLVEVARRAGSKHAALLETPDDILAFLPDNANTDENTGTTTDLSTDLSTETNKKSGKESCTESQIKPMIQANQTIGVSAGASTPEILVQQVLQNIQNRFDTTIETVTTAIETTIFKVPNTKLRQ